LGRTFWGSWEGGGKDDRFYGGILLKYCRLLRHINEMGKFFGCGSQSSKLSGWKYPDSVPREVLELAPLIPTFMETCTAVLYSLDVGRQTDDQTR